MFNFSIVEEPTLPKGTAIFAYPTQDKFYFDQSGNIVQKKTFKPVFTFTNIGTPPTEQTQQINSL